MQSLYTKKVLPNGLTLLLVPIDTAASVTMSIFVKAGSRYEEERLAGVSHFLEHLHFKGSKKFPTAKKLSEVVDSIGGEFNANTGKEHTQYYIRAAYEHLDLVFGVLTDMVQNPLFAEKEINRERGVIIEEINMYKDNPQFSVDALFEETLWPNQPLGRDIPGTAEVIQRISRKDILAYREKYYTPSNTIIAVAGHFDQGKLESLVEKNWGKLANRKHGTYAAININQKSSRVSIQTKQTEQAYMMLGFQGYAYRNKNNQALRLMSAVLGGGMSSRLFLRIRERLGLAYYVSTSFNNYLDAGNFAVSAGLKIQNVNQALDIILEELRKVKTQGISKAELSKAKEYIKGKIALAMEDPHDKLEWYLGQEAFMGRVRTIKQTFEEFEKVTLEDVSRVASQIIRTECLNLALVGPFTDKKVFEKKLKI
ncbi:MAG: insulinase family protein [Candidatus Doudnabacteria bacterium]|nr:insulinase family protein [Candidatus Doudnabacteria bacterium]